LKAVHGPTSLAPSIRDGVPANVNQATRLVSSEDRESSGAGLPASHKRNVAPGPRTGRLDQSRKRKRPVP